MRITKVLSLLAFTSWAAAQSSGAEEPPASTAAPEPSQSQPPPSNTPPPPSSAASSGPSSPPSSTPGGGSGGGGGGGGGSGSNLGPPDVHLKVPNLSVGKIELDVDNVRAEVNLAAEVANLVTINAGVQVGIEKVNITIADVRAELELIIRLGHLVDIVNRTLASLDLNPLLINLLNEVTDVIDNVVGAVDGLLGSILQGNTKLNFLIDNLGNIVQEVVGEAGNVVSSIVGNYQTNMTYAGITKELGNGLTQKTYKYEPLGSLVNIIFNTLGQVVQAVVVKGNQGGGGGDTGGGGTVTTTASTAAGTPAPTGGAR